MTSSHCVKSICRVTTSFVCLFNWTDTSCSCTSNMQCGTLGCQAACTCLQVRRGAATPFPAATWGRTHSCGIRQCRTACTVRADRTAQPALKQQQQQQRQDQAASLSRRSMLVGGAAVAGAAALQPVLPALAHARPSSGNLRIALKDLLDAHPISGGRTLVMSASKLLENACCTCTSAVRCLEIERLDSDVQKG